MKLNSIFTSGAVLPAGKPLRIFGEGEGKGIITFAGVTKEVLSEEGFFLAEFPPMQYGGPYTISLSSKEECVTLNDIYIGEVYLFAGQSNMEFVLKSSNTKKEDYKENPKLRLFCVPLEFTGTERWQEAKFGVIEDFSALGYLTGNKIATDKDVHVGIIACAMGASSIRSWLPVGTLERIGVDISPEKLHADHFGDYGARNHEGYLYAKKLSKIVPYSLSGAVWYQGESNAAKGEAVFYDKELAELIRIYRELFKNKKLPFTVVQLADTHERMADPGWKIVQDAQEKVALATEKTYLAVSRDISENDDIHPKSKFGLAMRIADIILENY